MLCYVVLCLILNVCYVYVHLMYCMFMFSSLSYLICVVSLSGKGGIGLGADSQTSYAERVNCERVRKARVEEPPRHDRLREI